MKYAPLIEDYRARYTSTPRVFRAPGRINVIGEHTDHNEGFVLPAAIDREIGVVLGPNDSEHIRLYSYDLQQSVSTTLKDYHQVTADWAQYILGVVDQVLTKDLLIGGFDAVIAGDIPQGAGLSSSAALECASLTALNSVFALGLDQTTVATMAQRAENEYVGVNCGIMDQYASVFGQAKQALRIDCRDLTYMPYSLQLEGYRLVLVDSRVSHNLKDSEYNTRRAECDEGVELLKKHLPGISKLRDVSPEALNTYKDQLPKNVYLRCKHVVEENERVQAACEAMERGDLPQLGCLLYQSHHGLQHEYVVSCPELDFLVDFTRPLPEVLGSRMMGGGFGGCTLNLIQEESVETFSENITQAYTQAYGKAPALYPVRTAPGASEITETLLQHV